MRCQFTVERGVHHSIISHSSANFSSRVHSLSLSQFCLYKSVCLSLNTFQKLFSLKDSHPEANLYPGTKQSSLVKNRLSTLRPSSENCLGSCPSSDCQLQSKENRFSCTSGHNLSANPSTQLLKYTCLTEHISVPPHELLALPLWRPGSSMLLSNSQYLIMS